jgi:hypothetical protein
MVVDGRNGRSGRRLRPKCRGYDILVVMSLSTTFCCDIILKIHDYDKLLQIPKGHSMIKPCDIFGVYMHNQICRW